MRERHERQRRHRGFWGVVLITLLGLMAAATPASAGSRSEQVRLDGVGLPAVPGEGNCLPDADLALQLTGTLEGCLSIYIEDFTCRESPNGNRADRYYERGREVFVGTIETRDGPSYGTFETTYRLKATMAAGSGCDFAQQLTGGCKHPLVRGSGTGGFESAKGMLRFTDRIPNPPGFAEDYPYSGRIKVRS